MKISTLYYTTIRNNDDIELWFIDLTQYFCYNTNKLTPFPLGLNMRFKASCFKPRDHWTKINNI